MDTKKMKRVLEHLWKSQELYQRLTKDERNQGSAIEDLYNSEIDALASELAPLALGLDEAANKMGELFEKHFDSLKTDIKNDGAITALIDDKLFSQLFNRKVFGYNCDGRLVSNGYLIGKHRFQYALMEIIGNTPLIYYVDAISAEEPQYLTLKQ